MPRIPTEQRRIQTTALRVAPQQEISPDAFGAGLGEQMQRTAGVIRQMEGQEWDRANQLKVDDAAMKVATKRLELTSRLRQARGDQALAPDFASGLEQELQGTLRDARNDLVNPAQMDAFEREAQRTELSFKDVVTNHILDQADFAAQAKADGLAATHVQNAVANRNDDGLAWQDLEAAQQVRMRFLQSRGVPSEAINAEMIAMRSGAVADIVTSLADDGNHVAAGKWMEASGGQLARPEDRVRAERAVRNSTTRGESQRFVDAQLARPGATLGDALAEAAKVEDPNLRAAIEERAVNMFSLRERARDETQTNIFTEAYKLAKSDPKGLDAVPQSTLDDLDPPRRQQLEAWAARQVKGENLPWQQSKGVRYELETKAATMEGRDAFARADLRPLLTMVNEDDFNALAKLQEDIRKGGVEGTFLTTRENIVNEALAGMGIDPRPWRTDDDGKATPNEAAISFRSAVEQNAMARAKASSRLQPTTADVQAAVDEEMMRTVKVRDYGIDLSVQLPTEYGPRLGVQAIDWLSRDNEKPTFMLSQDERSRAYVPIDQIPPGQAQAIRELIKERGGTITDDRVQRAYAAYQRNDRRMLDLVVKERERLGPSVWEMARDNMLLLPPVFGQ